MAGSFGLRSRVWVLFLREITPDLRLGRRREAIWSFSSDFGYFGFSTIGGGGRHDRGATTVTIGGLISREKLEFLSLVEKRTEFRERVGFGKKKDFWAI